VVKGASQVRIERLVLPRLRGFCAGVVRALDIVEQALELCGRPLYVRKEIIHNSFVVDSLRGRGVVFVDSLAEVPTGSWVVFSAHGVSPAVRQQARERGLHVIDATCPLVVKVHLETLRFARQGYTVLYIGHRDHDEAIGTVGHAPESTIVLESLRDAQTVEVPDPSRVAVLTQTTLSVDETRVILQALRRRFPCLATPATEDICYATTNRQNAVKAVAPLVDVLLVIGAPNSSNSQRLRETAEALGTPSYLIERAAHVQMRWLEGARAVGLTASASAPEALVEEVVLLFRERYGVQRVEIVETVEENVRFPLPSELVRLRERPPVARSHPLRTTGISRVAGSSTTGINGVAGRE